MQASGAGGKHSPSAPELVDKTNALVVERDRELVRRKPGVPLIVHGGSFVSERDAHHPTEVNLPQDTTVATLRNAGQQSEANALTIRHRWRHKTENVLSAFSKVRTIGHVRHDDLKAYIGIRERLADRVGNPSLAQPRPAPRTSRARRPAAKSFTRKYFLDQISVVASSRGR